MKLTNSSLTKLFLLLFICVSFLQAQDSKQLTIEDIYGSSKFKLKSFNNLIWLNDGEHFSFMEYDTVSKSQAIFLYSVKDNSRKILVTAQQLKLENDKALEFSSYQWSPDEKNILFISTPPQKQYLSRLTPAGNFFLYSVKEKTVRQLTNVDVSQYNQKFSPDGKMLGFVRNNNIYVLDIASGKETQLTTDGAEHIINGKFDWVYEEEFSISDGWQWSPDGSSIAYWRLDENQVPEYVMTEWDSLYLNLIKMRYPKAGEKNSIVKIGVVNLSTKKTMWMDLGNNEDIYIPRMQWTNEKNILSIQRLNRAQNTIELLFADVATGKTKTILTEKEEKWIDVHDNLTFLKSNKFLWSSEKDGYNHFYLYKNDGTLINQITKGEWEVDKFYGVDEKENVLYYSSTEISPTERHIYSISLDGKNKKQLTKETGTHSANFSSHYKYFLDTYSNISTPNKIRLMNNNGKIFSVLEENNLSALSEYSLANTTFFSFKTSDGVSLNASILKPANFDSTKKYPVLVFTYGGPGSQVVKNIWGGANELWYSMLAQKGYLVFKVDNRGTGGRGKAFKQIGYKNLGKWEVHDQIEGAKYLASLSYIDKNRIGIWGWSYGGYTSSMTILLGAEYFKTAVAVAPVTNWKFYDNIYTERFMGMPNENIDGYTQSSPITHADKLKGKFLLIHGTSDDNVHFQNSVNFATVLQKSGKQFSTMYYPNKNHGIYGGNTRVHLFTLITNFILENL